VKRLPIALIAALAACATTDPPESQMAAARAMVAHAQLAQPPAPVELNAAQEKLARAESAMQRGHYGHARLLAEEAEADARLAWSASERAHMQNRLAQETGK
jgi:hypothetical protein